jgi:biotin--protein ligase
MILFRGNVGLYFSYKCKRFYFLQLQKSNLIIFAKNFGLKSAQKTSIFSIKTNFERSLFIFMLNFKIHTGNVMIHKLVFTFFISLVFFSIEAFSAQIVYIYAGPGVSKKSLIQTENTISSLLDANYRVQLILPEQIIHGDWEKDAALLVIPGGADIPYTKALNGAGNQKIRAYVEKGGAFLGICAGGYYGGQFVDFAKGSDLEVQGKRELAFFPGTVRGPILAPYDYRSESSARAAKIVWKNFSGFQKNTSFTLYCNGGGYFVNADVTNNTTHLASYDAKGQVAAIVECQVGLGRAILSGVHFEYDPNLLDTEDEHLQKIIPDFKRENSKRIQLVQYLLMRLNLKCCSTNPALPPSVSQLVRAGGWRARIARLKKENN